MKIIFPMAGKGQRFKDAGYDIEKYEIIWNGKTLFEHSVNSLSSFFEYEFIFIGRAETNYINRIQKLISKTGVKNFSFFTLGSMTKGQAQTVYEYTKTISDSDILIFNIDSYIKPGLVVPSDIKTDYWWLVSKLDGEKWSFIKILENGTFVTSEKEKISDNASLGMYYWWSSDEFNSIYERFNIEISTRWNEVYIAPMYNYVPKSKKMSIKSISPDDFRILGTPEDLKNAG